jgi:hypothetical protein
VVLVNFSQLMNARCNKAHVLGQAEHSLAKVSGAAAKRIVPSWSNSVGSQDLFRIDYFISR